MILATYKNDQLLNHPTVAKLFSFFNLQKGWHFGEGDLISESCIYQSLEILLLFSNTEFESNVFPTINGGVNLSFSLGDNFIEITIEPNSPILLIHEKGFGKNNKIISENEDSNYDDINSLIIQIKNKCLLSELFQLYTITEQNEPFSQPPLEILQTDQEFQSFYEIA